jgi:hypothetical protein
MLDTATKKKVIPLVHHGRRTGLTLKVRPGVFRRPAPAPAVAVAGAPERYSATGAGG